jgi:hypothetical protein
MGGCFRLRTQSNVSIDINEAALCKRLGCDCIASDMMRHRNSPDDAIKIILILGQNMNRFLTLIVLISATLSANAATIVVDAERSGYVMNTGAHGDVVAGGIPPNNNYLVGVENYGTVYEFRNFFIFDIPTFSGSIVSAMLILNNPNPSGYSSSDPTETYTLFSYEGDLEPLSDGTGGVSVFDDLGGGTSYGSRVVSAADNESNVEIILDDSFLADVQRHVGLFAFGGRLTTIEPQVSDQIMFGATPRASPRQLILTTAVPIPAAVWLFGSALGLLGWMRRRET